MKLIKKMFDYQLFAVKNSVGEFGNPVPQYDEACFPVSKGDVYIDVQVSVEEEVHFWM